MTAAWWQIFVTMLLIGKGGMFDPVKMRRDQPIRINRAMPRASLRSVLLETSLRQPSKT
jgi:hypothetical protein